MKTRMFRYPLSYMIYSEAFDAMPQWTRDRVYQRLYDALTDKAEFRDKDGKDRLARITAADRRAVLEIVGETKAGLPAYWKALPAK